MSQQKQDQKNIARDAQQEGAPEASRKRPSPFSWITQVGTVFKPLLAYSKDVMHLLVIAIVLVSISTLLRLFNPSLMKEITNLITTGLKTTIDISAISRIAFTLIGIHAFRSVLFYTQGYLVARFSQELTARLRQAISEKVNRLKLNYFHFHEQGDVLSRVTNDVDNISSSMSNALPGLIEGIVLLIGTLIAMFVQDAVMALTALGSSLLSLVLLAVIAKRSQRHFRARQEKLGKLSGYVEEIYSGQSLVRPHLAEDEVYDRYEALNKDFTKESLLAQFFGGFMQPLMAFVGNFGYVMICFVGSVRAANGLISFGVITAFLTYVTFFQSAIQQLGQTNQSLQSALAAAQRVLDFLGEEEEPAELEKPEHRLPEDLSLSVTFRHLAFAYPDEPDKLVIKDFSAEIEPGQKVAIVGPTGAGKTTLVNLLMRFYEPTSGEILIGGIPISEMRRGELRGLFSMVLQDAWLFQGTIRENLIYNTPGVTDEDMLRATRACGVHSFIETLPHGYDSVLTDETAISQGQKQLLTIARAMIQKRPMLILDEATSSVDTRTELVTQRAMDHLAEGRTSFVIAHRLSTIQNADLILLIKDGDIVEQGKHHELLEQGGLYAELYRASGMGKGIELLGDDEED